MSGTSGIVSSKNLSSDAQRGVAAALEVEGQPGYVD